MALVSNKACIAAIAQSAIGTYLDPSANVMPCANLNIGIQGVNVANPEYTGTTDLNADEVIGRFIETSFDIMLRGPGGADVPAAGAYLPGIFLIAAKMAEVRTATAIPPSSEALSNGTTTGLTLGAGATGTADLYKGLLIELPTSLGASRPKSMTPIRSYTAGKVATLMETLGANATGNYAIPKQLSYLGTLSATEPMPLSMRLYYDGVALSCVDMAVTNLQFVVQTSERQQGSLPVIRVSLRGRISAKDDVSTPTIPSLGTVPKFRDGKCWLNRIAIGAQSFTLTRGIETAAGPNPNQPDGSDYEQIVSLRTTCDLSMQSYRKAVFDALALADAQTTVPFFAMWGNASGQTICINIPDARVGYAAPQLGGGLITESPTLLVDVFNRSANVTFPFW